MTSNWNDLLEPIPIASPESNKANLIQEMENIIPLIGTNEDVEAYYLAKSLCSQDVIQSEADPYRFVEYCNFNTWEASKRMIDYWNLRLEIFGRDRFWKRVLDTSGTEALHPECVWAVTHSVFLLPPNQHGRVVLYHQADFAGARDLAELLPDRRRALMFYGMQLAASQKASLKNGFVFLQIRTASDYKFFPETQRIFSIGTKSCFPMTCKEVRIVCTPKNKGNIIRRFSDQVLPFIWKILEKVASHAEHRTLDFVSWSNKRERSEKLANLMTTKFRLHPKGLPEIAGGPWNCRKFLEVYSSARQQQLCNADWSISDHERTAATKSSIKNNPMMKHERPQQNSSESIMGSTSDTTMLMTAPPLASNEKPEEPHPPSNQNLLNLEFFLLYEASQYLERKRLSQSTSSNAYIDVLADPMMAAHPTQCLTEETMDPAPFTKRSRHGP